MRTLFQVNNVLGQHVVAGDFVGVVDQARIAQGVVPLMRQHNTAQDFQTFASNFEAAVNQLIRSAEAENVEGTKNALGTLRSTCAACHRVYRKDDPDL